MHALQEGHRFGKIGTRQLQEALEATSGRALGPYFQEWVYGTRLPHLELGRKLETPGGNRVLVDLRARDLPGPVPVLLSIVHSGGRTSRTVTLEPAGGQFEFESRGPVSRVEINEDRGLLVTVGGR